MFFGSVRYSEDIDLDGTVEASDTIRGCIKGIFRDRALLRRLQRLGIRGLDPGEGPNKDTETTIRYKFGVIVPGDIRYPTKVEVSFRGAHPMDQVALDTPDEKVVNLYELEPAPVRHYVRTAAVRQKIDALGGRREVQARDVFDLHVLGAATPSESLLDSLAAVLTRSRLDESHKRAFEISYQEYRGQVLEFLAGEARSRYATDEAWDEIRLEVAALIERILARQEES